MMTPSGPAPIASRIDAWLSMSHTLLRFNSGSGLLRIVYCDGWNDNRRPYVLRPLSQRVRSSAAASRT